MTDIEPARLTGAASLLPTPEMFLPWDVSKPSAWFEHAPFMGWLVGRHRPRRFVELGTHWGFSYFAACAAAEAVGLQMESLAVDTWEGDEHAGDYDPDTVFGHVQAMNGARFGHLSQLFRGFFDDAAASVADSSLDLLHIDGCHTFDAVRHDFQTWLPKMGPRGVVLFHDVVERAEGFGVHRFWHEVAASYPSFRFHHGHGLGVLAVGEDVGPDVRWLTDQDGAPVGDQIRLYFRQLGRAVALEYGLAVSRTATAALTDHAAGLGELELPEFPGPATDLIVEIGRASGVVDGLLASQSRARRELEELKEALEHAVAREANATERLGEAVKSAGTIGELQDNLRRATVRIRQLRADVEASQAEVAGLRDELATVQGQPAPRALRALQAVRHPRRALEEHRRPAGAASSDHEQAGLEEVRRLFDPSYYLSVHEDVAAAGIDPWDHYRSVGASEGRRPSPLFDPGWYLEEAPEIGLMGMDPVEHYFARGALEGRDPIPLFDTDWYLQTYPDVAAAGCNPLLHFIEHGAQEGRDPGPEFDTSWYLDRYPDVGASGLNPLVHFIRFGASEGRLARDPARVAHVEPEPVAALLTARWPGNSPLRVLPGHGEPRINLVLEDTSSASLVGGSATAVVVAGLWSQRCGRRLRVVTRTAMPDAGRVAETLRAQGIVLELSPEYVEIPLLGGDYLETTTQDFYLTTTWSTTWATLQTVPVERIVHLVQHDERDFYPPGEDRLRVAQVLETPGLATVVNTASLLTHLRATGTRLSSTAWAFEPSVAPFCEAPRSPRSAGSTRDLILEVDPASPHSLFHLAIQAIDRAIEHTILDPTVWRINLSGMGIPRFSFCDGSVPRYLEPSWGERPSLLAAMDLGLSWDAAAGSMTQALEMAASGCVVLTSRSGASLPRGETGGAIIEREPSLDEFVEGLRDAVAEVSSPTMERRVGTPYSDAWHANLGETMQRLDRVTSGV